MRRLFTTPFTGLAIVILIVAGFTIVDGRAQLVDYADSVVSTGCATLVRSGSLTGAPDNDGYSFKAGCDGSEIVVGFSSPPPFADTVTVYIGGADVEGGDLYVSSDNSSWTKVGEIRPPVPNPYDSTGWIDVYYAVGFDVTGLGPVNYAKVVSVQPGNDGLEVDAFGLPAFGIDLKPGSYPNSVNLCSKGAVTVAILGSEVFDVFNIDLDSLILGSASPRLIGKGNKSSCSYEDVSGDFSLTMEGMPDSYTDLVCQYSTLDLGDVAGQSAVNVAGSLLDGTPFEGTDTINIVKQDCIQ